MTKLTNTKEKSEEAPIKLTEHPTRDALLYPLKVIASPFKAFREITQNPNLLGLLLIVVLFLLATVGAEYSRAAKIILDNGTPTSLLNSSLFSSSLTLVLVQSASNFFISWILYAGILLLITRFWGERRGLWHQFFIVVGYAFVVLVIYYAISALLISTLPEIHFQMSIWSSETQEDIAKVNNVFNEVWGPTLTAQVLTYLGAIFQFWLVALGAIAVHASREIKWGKAVIISVIAFFISVFLRVFLSAF